MEPEALPPGWEIPEKEFPIINKGRGVETFHSSTLAEVGSAKTVKLGQDVVRLSSAIGGASVIFGEE